MQSIYKNRDMNNEPFTANKKADHWHRTQRQAAITWVQSNPALLYCILKTFTIQIMKQLAGSSELPLNISHESKAKQTMLQNVK